MQIGDLNMTATTGRKVLQDLKVFVINLDRRPDRWSSVSKTLTNAGFRNIERVPAIDGKLIDSDNLKNLLHPEVYPQLGKIRKKHEDLGSTGAVGCSLSHYKVWNKIVEQDEPALIVEDDLICHPMFRDFQLSTNISMLNNYDFVLLSAVIRESALFDNSKLISNQGIVPYRGLFFGLHFYYLTPVGARFFMNDFFPLQYQVDSFMSFRMKNNSKFRAGVHYPEMGYQSGGSTDIQTPMDSVVTNFVIHVATAPIHKKIVITFCGLCILFVILFLITVSVQLLL